MSTVVAMCPLNPDQVALLLSRGRHMARDRHQSGWVEETGLRTKKWKGHYYVYVRRPDGSERRAHKAVILGFKSKMKKWEAEKNLQAIIDKETAGGGNVQPSPAYTLRWFWEHRYRPLKEATWKPSSRPKMIWSIDTYVIKPFADYELGKLARFELQKHLNGIAGEFSRSVVLNFRTYMKAILDEALEQEFISKNPARKLEIPQTRKPSSRSLTVEEIAGLLATMSGRDRLIARMFLVLGLRPGELFALRRDDRIASNRLRIDESNSPLTGIGETKTAASNSCIWMPQSIAMELDFWLDCQDDKRPEAFIFPSATGTAMSANNWLKRTLKIAGESAGIEGLTHQALRRSCATHMQHDASVKDIQAHLRHSRPNVTAEVYMQEIPASVRAAVESLDRKLTGSIEHN